MTQKSPREITERMTIVTNTRYDYNLGNDRLRGELAVKTIRTGIDLGYEIVIVDEESPDELLMEMVRAGARLFSSEQKGFGPSIRQAIREAMKLDRDIIAHTQPEKSDYILEIAKTAPPIIEDRAEIVIPKRKSMESYLFFQQQAEMLGNLFWKELTGTELDMWFGGRTWQKSISRYFLDYDGRHGDKWESIYTPIMDAIFDGKRVIGQEIDFTYPQKQKETEENNPLFSRKRIEQLENLTSALYRHWQEKKEN